MQYFLFLWVAASTVAVTIESSQFEKSTIF